VQARSNDQATTAPGGPSIQTSDAAQHHQALNSSREGGTMAQQAQPQAATQSHKQPKKSDLIFHLFKTVKLVGAVLKDKRVAVLRKIVYLGAIGCLLAAVLFPETVGDLFSAIFPPLLGIELPAEGAVDWLFFALATFSLLKLFPKDIVGEHYESLFRR
jgi:hypothetical protein